MNTTTNNNIQEYPGTWHDYYNMFKYKLMRYKNSCFPCSLHTILANLGYAADGNNIEDNWNKMLKEKYKDKDKDKGEDKGKGKGEDKGKDEDKIDLNHIVPAMPDLKDYLAQTPEINKCTCKDLFTPPEDKKGFATREEAENIAVQADTFMRAFGPSGIIVGVEHAHVFFQNAAGVFFHYNPSTVKDSVECEQIGFTRIEAVTGTDKTHAIRIIYNDINDEEAVVSATCVMLIR